MKLPPSPHGVMVSDFETGLKAHSQQRPPDGSTVCLRAEAPEFALGAFPSSDPCTSTAEIRRAAVGYPCCGPWCILPTAYHFIEHVVEKFVVIEIGCKGTPSCLKAEPGEEGSFLSARSASQDDDIDAAFPWWSPTVQHALTSPSRAHTTCTANHTLQLMKADGAFECDVCGKDIGMSESLHYCAECDYAACSTCYIQCEPADEC